MEITEVRIKLMEDNSGSNERLQAFCSITFDDMFVIRDLKIIEGAKGFFVAMPSRKLTDRCHNCGTKNHLRSRFCNQCGCRLDENRALRDADGRAKLHADIAHPINSMCREKIQSAVLASYADELERSKMPGYVSRYDDYEADDFDAPFDPHGAPTHSGANEPPLRRAPCAATRSTPAPASRCSAGPTSRRGKNRTRAWPWTTIIAARPPASAADSDHRLSQCVGARLIPSSQHDPTRISTRSHPIPRHRPFPHSDQARTARRSELARAGSFRRAPRGRCAADPSRSSRAMNALPPDASPPPDSAPGRPGAGSPRSARTRWRTRIVRIARIPLFVYLGLTVVMFSIQTRIIFPGQETQGQPYAEVRPRPGPSWSASRPRERRPSSRCSGPP